MAHRCDQDELYSVYAVVSLLVAALIAALLARHKNDFKWSCVLAIKGFVIILYGNPKALRGAHVSGPHNGRPFGTLESLREALGRLNIGSPITGAPLRIPEILLIAVIVVTEDFNREHGIKTT